MKTEDYLKLAVIIDSEDDRNGGQWTDSPKLLLFLTSALIPPNRHDIYQYCHVADDPLQCDFISNRVPVRDYNLLHPENKRFMIMITMTIAIIP